MRSGWTAPHGAGGAGRGGRRRGAHKVWHPRQLRAPLKRVGLTLLERVGLLVDERDGREKREEHEHRKREELREVDVHRLPAVMVLPLLVLVLPRRPARARRDAEKHVEDVFRRELVCVHLLPMVPPWAPRPLPRLPLLAVAVVVRALVRITQHLKCVGDLLRSAKKRLMSLRRVVQLPLGTLTLNRFSATSLLSGFLSGCHFSASFR